MAPGDGGRLIPGWVYRLNGHRSRLPGSSLNQDLSNYRIDPSQGTHFFQNLTSFRVGYFTINPFINEGFYDVEFLNNREMVYEDEFIRHVQFHDPLEIMVDGRTHKGVILKPGQGYLRNY